MDMWDFAKPDVCTPPGVICECDKTVWADETRKGADIPRQRHLLVESSLGGKG